MVRGKGGSRKKRFSEARNELIILFSFLTGFRRKSRQRMPSSPYTTQTLTVRRWSAAGEKRAGTPTMPSKLDRWIYELACFLLFYFPSLPWLGFLHLPSYSRGFCFPLPHFLQVFSSSRFLSKNAPRYICLSERQNHHKFQVIA